jgi:hypothetical protein
MSRRMLLGLCFCALLVDSGAVAKGPFGSVKIGNWSGGAYTNDNTGQFTACSAGAAYQNGIYFIVSMNPAGGWSLGFVHPSWRLQPSETFPVDLTFDGQAQFHVYGTALSDNLVTVPMPANSALMNQFRKSLSLLESLIDSFV